MKTSLFLLLFVLSFEALSLSKPKALPKEKGQATSHKAQEQLSAVLKGYFFKKGVQVQLKKTVFLKDLDLTRESNGELLFSKGLFRLTFSGQQKSFVVFGEKFVWIGQKIFQTKKEKWSVQKIKKSKLANRKPLFSIIFDKKTFFEKLELKKVIEDKNEFILEAKKGQKIEFKTLKITLNSQRKYFSKLETVDHLGNVTTYKFVKEKFLKTPVNKNKFTYNKSKGQQL